MGLYKRPNSSNWQMCFFVNGKKVRMSTNTTNKKIAQRIFDKKKGEVAEGKFSLNAHADMPFDRLVDEFLEKHSKVEKASYLNDVLYGKRFIEYFKSKPIGKITSYDIKSWRQWRMNQPKRYGGKLSKGTVNRELAMLKTMFSLAVEWEWLSENPAAKIKKLKGENKRTRFLSDDEVTRLLSCSSSWLKPIIITAISTGMRRGEILSLKWQDVDFERGFIRVVKSKNYESRDIPINDYLTLTLRRLERDKRSEYVFSKQDGGKRRTVKSAFQSARARAGLEDFRFHDLRHTAASLFASNGCDIITLQHILGHKTITMTQRYAHLIPEKHERTRRIMNDYWCNLGDTFSYTPVSQQAEKGAKRPVIKPFEEICVSV